MIEYSLFAKYQIISSEKIILDIHFLPKKVSGVVSGINTHRPNESLRERL